MRLLDADLPLIPPAVPHDLFGVRALLAYAPRLDFRIDAAGMRRVRR